MKTNQYILFDTYNGQNGLDWFMTMISFMGKPAVLSLILGVVMLVTYYRKNLSLLITEAIVLAFVPMFVLLKLLFHRPRPETSYVEQMAVQTYSFPSGHAYTSLLILGFFVFIIWHYNPKKWKIPAMAGLVLLILLIGISRVYLGAHYPLDVAGGWLFGFLALIAIIKLRGKNA